jgi:hypothetical protein
VGKIIGLRVAGYWLMAENRLVGAKRIRRMGLTCSITLVAQKVLFL